MSTLLPISFEKQLRWTFSAGFRSATAILSKDEVKLILLKLVGRAALFASSSSSSTAFLTHSMEDVKLWRFSNLTGFKLTFSPSSSSDGLRRLLYTIGLAAASSCGGAAVLTAGFGAFSVAAAASDSLELDSFFLSLSRELLIPWYSSSPPSNLVSLKTRWRETEDARSSLRIPTEEEETAVSSSSLTGIGLRLTCSTSNLLCSPLTTDDFLRLTLLNSDVDSEAALPLLEDDLEDDSTFLRETPSTSSLRLPLCLVGLPARDPGRDPVFLRTSPLNSGFCSSDADELRRDKTDLLIDVKLVKEPVLERFVLEDASTRVLFLSVLCLCTWSSASCSRLGV